MAGSGGRRSKRWTAWLLMLASSLACAGLAEVVLRMTAPIYLAGIPEAYRYDQEIGYLLKSGIHMLKTTDHLQEIRTNRLGTVNFEEDFSDYPGMLFAIGDSFTAGTGLAADASYPFQLSMMLNRDGNGMFERRVAVVNLGLAALGMEQSLLVLRRYRKEIGNPDGVLLLGCQNDFQDDLLFESGYRHQHIVDDNPMWGPLVAPLQWASNFELAKRTKLAIGSLRASLIRGAGRNERRPADRSVAEAEWPIIEKIIRDASESGSFVVLGWADGESDSYLWLKQKAREREIPFADWYPRARAVMDAIPELSISNPHSAGHWRTWVNRLIAEEYARQVAGRLH